MPGNHRPPPRRCCDSVVGPRAIDGRGFSLVFQPAGGWGVGLGGGLISDSSTAFMLVFSFGSNVRFRGRSSRLRSRPDFALCWLIPCFPLPPNPGSFVAVCPEYLDSLFDVVTQTPDPCLSLVAEIVLLPHRFPLAFDSLGLCLPVLWSAYRPVLRRSAYFPPSRLVSLASCLHVVSNRLLGARLLAVLPARGPAMAAQPPSVRSAGRSRTPPPARSREPRLPWVLVCFFFADGLSLSIHQFVLCPSGTCLLACCN